MREPRTETAIPAIARAAALAALVTTGCGGGAAPEPAATPADVATARAVFENESCGMCHGAEGEGTDLAPALANLDGYWDEDRIVRYLEDPGAFATANPSFDARRDAVYEMEMPTYGHVPEADRRSLARWLLSR